MSGFVRPIPMPSNVYDWKRFWCPRTGHFNLSDQGYLYDPDSDWGNAYNPDVVTFESIANTPCLVLLGEPGIGKSYALAAEYEAVVPKIEEEGGQTLRLDLRQYGSEDRLVRNLFESSTFQSWAIGEYVLHLFLDSLDECLLWLDNLAALLTEELKRYPVERLRLRIACRTADWQNTLEVGLQQLWGSENVAVYELAPLRRADVREAAQSAGLDPDSFLEEIDHKEIAALAIKPVTLNLLINMFDRTGQFPSTQAELYRQGCGLLCEETNESRRDASQTGDLSADQRITVAARIAAITVFGGKYAVWTGVDQGDVPDVDVTINQLCGGTEIVDGPQFEITEQTVEETLSTGLFSSRGPNRMGWAHQTYAEFLAAWYLVQHEMTLGQIMSLIASLGDPDGKLVPQLQEASAWLAGMDLEIFRELTRRDPQVLLRSDVATADVQDRAGLVAVLLQQFDDEVLLDRDWSIRSSYRKLAHPNLAEQIRPYLLDQAKGVVVRRVATYIAAACNLKSLQEDLVNIALDPSEEHEVRKNSAFAVSRIGDDETKAKLKPLAKGEAGNDPDDGLKGCGLMAVWPSSFSAKELFTALTPPQQPSFVGIYAMFLSSSLMANLAVSDLPEALNWVEEQLPKHQLGHPFEDVVDTIMLQAWENLETPGVLEAFAKAALSRLKQYDLVFGVHGRPSNETTLSEDDEKRRSVLKAAVPMLLDPEKEAPLLVFSRPPIVLGRDFQWMVEQLQSSQAEKIQKTWIEVIFTAFDLREHDHPDVILQACQECPILREKFIGFISPVGLDSAEAEDMRGHYLKRQKWLNQDDEQPSLEPPPAARIAACLESFESSDLAAWLRLNLEMTLKPNSKFYGDQFQPNLTLLPGWEEATTEIRYRIVQAAKGYVLEQDPAPNDWVGGNTFPRSVIAGYSALRLIQQEAPGFLADVPSEIWEKWAPIILAAPTTSGLGDEEPVCKLVSMAYQYAPAQIIETLMAKIDQENTENNSVFILRKVSTCFDQRLAIALLAKAKEEHLKPESMGCLLAPLLDYGLADARTFAESLLLGLPHSDESLWSRAVVAATLLLTRTEDGGWETVWPAIQQDAELGQSVISRISTADDRHAEKIAQRLQEDQLADLYIWVARQYPHADDTPLENSGLVSPRMSISWWRDSLLTHLKARGTQEACNAIRRIAGEMPGLDWLKWILQEAEAITRMRTWVPAEPDHILKLASSKELRLVESGEQLLEVLIESLERLEQKLHGEVPASRDIWDLNPGNDKYRPNNEERFSDYVKGHLDGDIGQKGVVVNREVQIHRGERTDLHVDAIVPHESESYRVVSVIIEVKGCWNQGLSQAMETQLVDRYLKDNSCQYGLYLVGWFNCDSWDNEDGRNARAPSISLDQARDKFEAQAASLSQNGKQLKSFVMDTALH